MRSRAPWRLLRFWQCKHIIGIYFRLCNGDCIIYVRISHMYSLAARVGSRIFIAQNRRHYGTVYILRVTWYAGVLAQHNSHPLTMIN